MKRFDQDELVVGSKYIDLQDNILIVTFIGRESYIVKNVITHLDDLRSLKVCRTYWLISSKFKFGK